MPPTIARITSTDWVHDPHADCAAHLSTVLVVHEYDIRTASVLPALDSIDEMLRVIVVVFTTAGADVHDGARLSRLFAQAGIGSPEGTDVAGRMEPLSTGRTMRSVSDRSPTILRMGGGCFLTSVGTAEDLVLGRQVRVLQQVDDLDVIPARQPVRAGALQVCERADARGRSARSLVEPQLPGLPGRCRWLGLHHRCCHRRRAAGSSLLLRHRRRCDLPSAECPWPLGRLGIGRQALFAVRDPLQLGLLRGDLVLQRGQLRLPVHDAPPKFSFAVLQSSCCCSLASRSPLSWLSRAEPVITPAGPTYTSTSSIP